VPATQWDGRRQSSVPVSGSTRHAPPSATGALQRCDASSQRDPLLQYGGLPVSFGAAQLCPGATRACDWHTPALHSSSPPHWSDGRHASPVAGGSRQVLASQIASPAHTFGSLHDWPTGVAGAHRPFASQTRSGAHATLSHGSPTSPGVRQTPHVAGVQASVASQVKVEAQKPLAHCPAQKQPAPSRSEPLKSQAGVSVVSQVIGAAAHP